MDKVENFDNESESQEKSLKESKKDLSKFKDTHIRKKRAPFGLIKSPRDIYVTRKTSFKAQLKKCEKLFDSGLSEICIHGLGKSITRACNLALQLKTNHHGTLNLDVKTSTVDLIDDLEPRSDDADYEVVYRKNSAIHIRVSKMTMMHSLKEPESS